MAVVGIPGLLRWAPNTAYKAGEKFAAPNGDIVTVNTDFTSGAAYSAANVTASAQDGRIHALEVLGGLGPGDTSDVTVAGLLGSATQTRDALDARYVNEGTPVSNTEIAGLVTGAGATRDALDARYVNEGTPVSNSEIAALVTGVGDTKTALDAGYYGRTELGYNARRWGVVPGGSDIGALLNQAAIDVFNINPDALLFIEPGQYTSSVTINVRCGLRATGAYINFTNTGDGLTIGSSTAGQVTFRRAFFLPRVVKSGRTNLWDGSSRGVVLYNLNDCYVDVPFVQDFEHGLVLMGNNAGCAYNKVMMGSLWENHNNHVLDTAGVNGYTNENTFFGGRLQHSLTKGATANDPNAHQILAVGMNAEGGPNNNRWIGTSLEGPQVAQYRIEVAGSHNQFLHCRWESPNNDPIPIKWRDTAVSNVLFYGYGLVNVVEVFDKTNGTISPSIRYDSAGLYVSPTTTSSVQTIPNNTTTDITSWNATPTMRGCTYNSTTGEFTPRPGRWEIHATVTFAINGTGRRMAYLLAGGSNIGLDEIPPSATNRTVLKVSGIKRFNGSETFKLQVNQTSGADLNLESTSGYVRIRATYLGG